MPISTNKRVVCKYCGKQIKIVRTGDVISPEKAKVLFDSSCFKCKMKKLFKQSMDTK